MFFYSFLIFIFIASLIYNIVVKWASVLYLFTVSRMFCPPLHIFITVCHLIRNVFWESYYYYHWLLCFQLAADPDPNVKNGAELLDRLIKVSHYQRKLRSELTDQLHVGSRDPRFWMMILIWVTWGLSVCSLQMM